MIFAALSVVLGSISQRVAGLGFALLVAPVFVLTFGPYDGVVLINYAGTVSSIVVLIRLWRDVNWKRYLALGPPAAIAIIPTSYVVVNYQGPVLQVVIGAILIIGLTLVLSRPKPEKEFNPRWWITALTGGAAGITSATAGVGAPPMGMYAAATGWSQREFAATLQPVFVTTGATSFLSKVGFAGGVPSFHWSIWVGVLVLSALGLALGEVAKRFISGPTARVIAFALCYVGAVLATADGIVEILGASQLPQSFGSD
jgi:uncharacterized membrane protein YfcA